MWRRIGKLIFHIAIVVLPVVFAMELFCAAFPELYMDGEYAMYKQQKDYISENTDYNRVLIIGDSRAKACFKPEELGDDVYNISLGGISPVESYYMLREYLEHHDAPDYLFLAYAPVHQCQVAKDSEDYVLWNRCIYFHTFYQQDFFEIKKTAAAFENTEIIDREHFFSEYMMYRLYLPNKYGTALKKSLFENRYRINTEKYVQMEAQRGYSLFGTSGVNGGLNAEAKLSDFAAADLVQYYYEKIFDLCRENDIQAIVEQPPMTETSYYVITQDFRIHYDSYLSELAEKYPEVWINRQSIMLSDSLFGDIDHLNDDGAGVFSDILKKRYPQVFRE